MDGQQHLRAAGVQVDLNLERALRSEVELFLLQCQSVGDAAVAGAAWQAYHDVRAASLRNLTGPLLPYLSPDAYRYALLEVKS